MDTWELTDVERKALITDLETLTPEQWNVPTLCEGWSVRDVVAHLASLKTLSAPKAMLGIIAARGDFNKWMYEYSCKAGQEPVAKILQSFKANVGLRKTPPFAKPVFVLLDTVVHGQDIRRSLGLSRTHDFEALKASTESILKQAKFYPGTRRSAGLKLVASDHAWSHGEGPEVTGTLEAICMAVSGRRSVESELAGEGAATYRGRD